MCGLPIDILRAVYLKSLTMLLAVIALASISGCIPSDSTRKVQLPDELKQGQELMAKRDFNGAVALFDKGIARDRKQPVYYAAAADSCASASRWDLAVFYCEQGLAITPKTDKGALLMFYGTAEVAYSHLGNHARALELVKAARALEDSPMLKNDEAYVYAQMQQNLDEALALSKQAVKEIMKVDASDATVGVCLDTYGWVLYRKGAYDEALATLQRSAELVPEASEVHYHVAMALLAKQRKPEATIELDRAHRLEPTNVDINNSINELRSQPLVSPEAH